MRRPAGHISRSLAILFSACTLVLLGACAQDQQDTGEMQPEAGEGIESETEMGGEMMGDEYAEETGHFNNWDGDADGYLTEQEFGSGSSNGTFWNDWDADSNTYLNQNEFNTAFGDADWFEGGLFDEWDQDGDDRITRDEWETGLFGEWDADGDGRIAEQEYQSDLFG